MAGKPKKIDDDAILSKTARASKGKKRDEAFHASGELDRVYSLAGGTYTRILDPRDGSSHHLRVGSDSYEFVVSELLATDHGERIRSELVSIGFPIPG